MSGDLHHDALQADLAAVRSRLEGLLEGPAGAPVALAFQSEAVHAVRTGFGLSEFEGSVLLLCAAVELDSSVAELCGRLHGHDGAGHASFALASRAFAGAHWSALGPAGPLRYWDLLEIEARRDVGLAQARLRIRERILHHLVGLTYVDESLHAVLDACAPPDNVLPAHRPAVARIARWWSDVPGGAVALSGCDARCRRDVVAQACAEAGLRMFALRGEDAPAEPAASDRLARAWMREDVLSPAVLWIEGGPEPHVRALARRIRTALAVGWDDGAVELDRRVLRLHLASPTAHERRGWWQAALGQRAAGMNGELEALAGQFALSPAQIAAAVDAADGATPEALWEAGRLQARPRLDELAQRIEPRAGWDDLVLPPAQRRLLTEIGTHVRQRLRVYEDWGFGAASRGLGISALFAGASGTGKTMAAEVLAGELQLDLYRIDLSQVVSKYIGETEKNLRRVFDAAEGGGAILLFDEADALFGKRSEVKDSHDRYANIEVSYLLQRMEAYRGLAILTTNQRSALDPAFLRRLRFVVEFPFPDAALRAEIWRRVFPAATPTDGLRIDRLARLNVPGGNIRNIAMSAAFLAAAAGRPVRMDDLLRAARTEYAKLETALSDAEVRDWCDGSGA